MEQATSETESAITEEAAAEPSVVAREATTSQEEPADQEQIDDIRYDSRMSNTTYTSSHKTRQKVSKEITAKKSPTKGGLEKVISNIEIEAERLGVDKAEYLSKLLSDRPIAYSKSESDETEHNPYERLPDGAIVIVYHENKKTGKIEFYFEQKSPHYSIESERGKLALVGGLIEPTDRTPLETLLRETVEEIEDKQAQSVLINTIRGNGFLYGVFPEKVGKRTVYNYVYAAKVDSERDWGILNASSMTHDAGNPRNLTIEDTIKAINKKYFAFTHGEILKDFIGQNLSPQIYTPFFRVRY